ncbi:MAG: proline dehydrogenase, partial [Armatimonadota bacterium]|nr:proline dehydrogenase [Armatimonadota bacterium]
MASNASRGMLGPEAADAMLRQLFLTLARNTTAQEAATHSRLLRPAVRRFVAGETLADGIAAVAALNARGIEATLDVLGEATASEEDARQAARDSFEVLNAIFHRGLRS